MRVGMRHAPVNQRIVGRNAQCRIQRVDGLLIAAHVIQRVGQRQLQTEIVGSELDGSAILLLGAGQQMLLAVGGSQSEVR